MSLSVPPPSRFLTSFPTHCVHGRTRSACICTNVFSRSPCSWSNGESMVLREQDAGARTYTCTQIERSSAEAKVACPFCTVQSTTMARLDAARGARRPENVLEAPYDWLEDVKDKLLQLHASEEAAISLQELAPHSLGQAAGSTDRCALPACQKTTC